MPSNEKIVPSSLSIKDLPWQIAWSQDKCTLCGRCTTVCPVHAIELGVFRKRMVDVGTGIKKRPVNDFKVYYGIRQRTSPAYHCVGCGMCTMVCPNDAIIPMRSDEAQKLYFHINQGGEPQRRGGRRNSPGGLLDRVKFTRISMLTDPALDAGRHEFELRTLLVSEIGTGSPPCSLRSVPFISLRIGMLRSLDVLARRHIPSPLAHFINWLLI